MTKIVSIINLKGGVAKTTTTIQLAEALSCFHGKRVLIVDLDPQTNAIVALIGEAKWEEADQKNQTIFSLFNDILYRESKFDRENAILKNVSNVKDSKVDLLCSNIKLIKIENKIRDISDMGTQHSVLVLEKYLKPFFGNYDYILIDCPPNFGPITRNGINISTHYLIPTIADKLSTWGIPQIIEEIKQFTDDRAIDCIGLVVTKFVSRSPIHMRGVVELRHQFPTWFSDRNLPSSHIFETLIPDTSQTAAAMEVRRNFRKQNISFREKYGSNMLESGQGVKYPAYEYPKMLAKEVIERVERRGI